MPSKAIIRNNCPCKLLPVMNRSSHRRWLKTFRKSRLSVLCLALLLARAAVCRAETDSPAPEVQLVAPGIWRLHYGNPEQFTPTHFRSAEIDDAGLKKMAARQPIPLD